ncbi:RNA polymerase sigma factor, sigma-70 family [Desulfurispirillum indicum S5]|uniref:RNA polymerase sigma factor, sigma-70 family n=1 Tax=Desulfurispirillum indicum (strain ATCC BAA-1389 / DSM 22839 / S5) TaxID=653733 RepID=E6W1A4_DESIS|nr:RNA polymerase sigma factor [Desulfurispirillum indicum]ADU66524.1 RNA polymerase sigma factor, sigma-70 family [Desulfurispirillum indicum S5]
MSDQSPQGLFRDYQKEVFRYFNLRVRAAGIADDLTQETFLRLLRSSIRILNPQAYLLKIARNVLIDYYRSSRTLSQEDISEEEWENAVGKAPSPEEAYLTREELEMVLQAIEELPPRGKQIFEMHRLQGLSYQEIALRTGISRNTVMVHITRALAHCKKRLNAYRSQREES